MKPTCRIREQKLRLRMPNALRAAVAGFGVLIAVPFLSACTDRKPNYAAISEDKVPSYEAERLAKSEDPKERMKGVGIIGARSRKGNYASIHYGRILTDLARDSAYADVRMAVVNETNDPNMLSDIVVFSPHKDNAMAALEKLATLAMPDNPDRLLVNAVAHARNDEVRAVAPDKLGRNETALVWAYDSSTDRPEMRRVFVERLAAMAKDLRGENAKILVALYSEDANARLQALERLRGNISRVGDVAQQSSDETLRMQALGMLINEVETANASIAKDEDIAHNQKTLAEVREALEHIFTWSRYGDVKQGAQKLLQDFFRTTVLLNPNNG